MMFTKKKLDIAKRIAAINYIIENKTLDNAVECDMKIIDTLCDTASLIGGIKMLNTVQECLAELRRVNI